MIERAFMALNVSLIVIWYFVILEVGFRRTCLTKYKSLLRYQSSSTIYIHTSSPILFNVRGYYGKNLKRGVYKERHTSPYKRSL